MIGISTKPVVQLTGRCVYHVPGINGLDDMYYGDGTARRLIHAQYDEKRGVAKEKEAGTRVRRDTREESTDSSCESNWKK